MARLALWTGRLLQGLVLGALLAMAVLHLLALTGSTLLFRYQAF